MVDVFLLLL